jgi:predicted dehydrogenase
MLRVAVVGAGQMGSSHARVVAESSAAELAVVIDIDAEAAKRVAEQYGTQAATELSAAFDCDAVVVAGSTSARMAVVRPLLEAGRPLLVEKPFAPTLAEVDELLQLAEAQQLPVMCGFVERFNAALRTAVAAVDGPPLHVVAMRHSPPAPRIAASVVTDLMLHDLDVAQRLFGELPARLAGAACVRPPNSQWCEIADATVEFGSHGAGHGVATLSANRMGHRKIRSLSVYTATQLIEVDLLRQDVTVYRNVSHSMALTGGGLGYRSSTEIELPFVRHTGEPLTLQFAHFVALVRGAADPAVELRQIRPAHELADAIEARSQH